MCLPATVLITRPPAWVVMRWASNSGALEVPQRFWLLGHQLDGHGASMGLSERSECAGFHPNSAICAVMKMPMANTPQAEMMKRRAAVGGLPR